ncbi:MAG: SDR family oxidoreductase [Litorivicinus sp.]
MASSIFTPPTVLVTGASGQTGRALTQLFDAAGFTTVGMDRTELDVCSEASVQTAINAVAPDFVVNCARYPDVDRAESEGDAAHRLLVEGPANLAMACRANNAILIHLSSEYVFDGSDGPYSEGDPTAPLSLFGHYCREGELEVERILSRHIVLRVGLVFSADPRRFVWTTLQTIRAHKERRMVSDEIGTPTSIDDLGRVLVAMIKQLDLGSEAFGIYHYGGGGSASWFEMGELIYAQASQREDLPADLLQPVRGDEVPGRAPRPQDVRLNCDRLLQNFGIKRLPWRSQMIQCVDQIYRQESQG